MPRDKQKANDRSHLIGNTERARELAAKRKNPGRKKQKTKDEIREDTLRQKLEPEIDGVVKRLISLSKSKHLPTQMRACSQILDRFYGKPVESMELSGPKGGAIPLTVAEALLDESLDK